MRHNLFRAMTAAAFLAAAGPATAQQAQVINVPLSRPGDPIRLEIDIQSAHIEVVGEDRDDASFEISVAEGERRIITPSGTKMLKGGGMAFEVEEDDNEISVDADWRNARVTVIAHVPRHADAALQTVNDGEIIARDLIGNLELYNTNGPITATNISGSVIAESVNDTIDVAFASIDDTNATSFESINGDLILGLPADAGARIQLDSARGEIYSDFEVDVEATEPTVERDDDNDGVSIRIESIIVARVNGGGPSIRMKTLQGDIRIRKLQ